MNQQPKTVQTIILIAILALVLVVISSSLLTQNSSRLAYSDVLDLFENERVESFVLQGDTLTMTLYASDTAQAGTAAARIGDIETFHKDLDETIAAQSASGILKSYNYLPAVNSIWRSVLPYLVVGVALLFVWFILMNRSGGSPNAMSQFTRANARFGVPNGEAVTFKDVAGADEEKEELSEIVEFLRDPDKFRQLGAKIPKGVLLVGPPGTGKTLLARAVAGEANVAFLSISGSDFVELYVGVGASRVRDLFDQAKRVAPAIVFIDEIDAVGRQRGAGLGGGHDEREQTLNQLLVEMDGFSANEGVIVIAATNRKDILDPALLRPGRFDRQIYVGAPDWRGRAEILQVHARKKPLADNVDLPAIAKATAGFTGADLANLLNEGALLAARNGKAAITQQDLEAAMIKVIAGPEKKSRVVSHSEKMLTAVHEAGHAVCMYCLDSQDPVHLITIIPRAQAGGMTISLPQDDKSYASRNEMFETVVSFLGGRVAEALKLCDISTGASNDLQRATKLARDMVATYGMSDAIGPVSYSSSQEVFIGRDYEKTKPYSEATAGEIDVQVQSIMREAYKRCEEILNIQAMGLKKRMEHIHSRSAVVGLSGGLDSTLALLVMARAFDRMGMPREQIHCVTMPCFGTTDRTYQNACKLSRCLGARLTEVNIKEAVNIHFRDIGHDPEIHDVTYENSQARERTQILMDTANKEGGVLVGTGDLSELALGWATYNGDHMSMYGVNASVPKTLVRHLVRYYADTCGDEELKEVLLDILDTPVSPELLPPKDGKIAQKTEDLVGPYELHDFYLYYMLRAGFTPDKIYRLACLTFEGIYDKETILKWLKTFYRRFFAQQFKRSCLPDGPKVGSVALSPRGDLRMPSDASARIWQDVLEKIEI